MGTLQDGAVDDRLVHISWKLEDRVRKPAAVCLRYSCKLGQPSRFILDRLPPLIGELECRNNVRVRDRDRGPRLRHGSTVTTVPLEGVAQGKHIDGGRCATAGRPAPRLRGCYRGVRAQASATTLPASVSTLAQYSAHAAIRLRRLASDRDRQDGVATMPLPVPVLRRQGAALLSGLSDGSCGSAQAIGRSSEPEYHGSAAVGAGNKSTLSQGQSPPAWQV